MPTHEPSPAPDGAQPTTAAPVDESKLTLTKDTLAELDPPPGDTDAVRGGLPPQTGTVGEAGSPSTICAWR